MSDQPKTTEDQLQRLKEIVRGLPAAPGAGAKVSISDALADIASWRRAQTTVQPDGAPLVGHE